MKYLRILRRLPRPAVEWGLAAMAITNGMLRNGRVRQALAWAQAQGAVGPARYRLALAIVANHGRYVADEVLGPTAALARDSTRVVVEGAEHLAPHSGRGALVLGFHLGPPVWFALKAQGYPVRFAGRINSPADGTEWTRGLAPGDVIPLPDGHPASRAAALYRIHGLLAQGIHVYLTADGPLGREAFRFDLPGGPMLVRGGWLALRRATLAPTLPLLTFRSRGCQHVVIHPPLPAPLDDETLDVAACRAVLAPLLSNYVKQFPTECRWLAFKDPHLSQPPARRESDDGSGATVLP